MYLVGLTGGIGSGKSTVAARLVTLGAHLIDADQVARDVVRPGSAGLEEIVARFGNDVVAADGTLDRAALAGIVFADDAARADLDAITHPRIGVRIAERVEEHVRAEADEPRPRLVVVDHPLLIETGQASAFPAVVVVIASEEVRVRRLEELRGMAPADARARIAAQARDDERRAAASHVITNDGDVDDLHRQVDGVFADLRRAADAPSAAR